MEPNWDGDTLLAYRFSVKGRSLFQVMAGNRCEQKVQTATAMVSKSVLRVSIP
jgi:hypothetical protein